MFDNPNRRLVTTHSLHPQVIRAINDAAAARRISRSQVVEQALIAQLGVVLGTVLIGTGE